MPLMAKMTLFAFDPSILGPLTLVGIGTLEFTLVRHASGKFSMTIHCIFLKFCMELQLYMGECNILRF